MPVGLENAPGTLKRTADVVLGKVRWQTALVYSKYVIVYFENVAERYDHLRVVIDILMNSGVSLHIHRYRFFRIRAITWSRRSAPVSWK